MHEVHVSTAEPKAHLGQGFVVSPWTWEPRSYRLDCDPAMGVGDPGVFDREDSDFVTEGHLLSGHLHHSPLHRAASFAQHGQRRGSGMDDLHACSANMARRGAASTRR